MNSVSFLCKASVFDGRKAPEEGHIVGYAAIIHALNLPLPIPDIISLISIKNRKYTANGWSVYTPTHQPEDNLYKQLVFAIRYEGVNLLFFKKLFEHLSEKEVVTIVTEVEPTGQYSRKIWFLYEWLMQKSLPINNAAVKIKYTLLQQIYLQRIKS